MTEITLEEPGSREAAQLAAMLCEDDVLRGDLGMGPDRKPTADSFLEHLAEWCASRRATTYAILADDVAVGTISISHRSPDGRSARVGYWMGSRHRRQGHCTRAFEAVLARAAAEGIRCVSATIAADNLPSRRLWERQGGVPSEVSEGRLRYELPVGSPAAPPP